MGVLACGDGINGMFSEQACHLHFIFQFLHSSSSLSWFPSLVLRAATASVEITRSLRFCVRALLPRAMMTKGCFPRERAICKYRFTFHFRALSRVLCVAALADFFRVADFSPATRTIFFGRYFIFANATHFIFSPYFCISDFFEIQFLDSNACGRLSGS